MVATPWRPGDGLNQKLKDNMGILMGISLALFLFWWTANIAVLLFAMAFPVYAMFFMKPKKKPKKS